MAIEEALTRLARAIELQGEGAAVAELIRQRDAAIKECDRWKRDADFYMRSRDDRYRDWECAVRVNRALRAVITKMKNKHAKESADATP